MNRNFLALCAILTVPGCAACNPEPVNPCDPNPCENATACSAKDGKPVCACKENFYPDSSGNCSYYFSPDSLAFRVFCPAETGRLEISGQSGSLAAFNGFWANIRPDTFDRCVWVLLNPAFGYNLPTPANGQIISIDPKTPGLSIEAVDRDNPRLANGNHNTVQPLKEVELMFPGFRGTIFLHNESDNRFEDVPFSIVPDAGSLGSTLHFSPFYLVNTAPAASAKATRKTGRTVEVDFTGTLDESSPLSWRLTHEIWENGTLLDQRVSSQVWELDLPGGNHTLTFKVKDPYGMEDSKTVNVVVDLCTGNACLNWQTCREVDGVCVGTDPCLPNPCQHGGSCSPPGVGTTICLCDGNWNGTDCNTCPPGFYIDGAGACVTDRCFGVTCGDGNPCNGTETCDSATGCVAGTPVTCASDNNVCNGTEQCNTVSGACESVNPITCASDGNVCNGTEQCNTATGACASVNPLVCNNGLACDGSETCNPSVGCVSGTAQTCGGHGVCQEPSASCACAAGFDPATDCSACLSGYGGANCDPAPTISGLAIDCSSTGGFCGGGGWTYPMSFTYTNATSCIANQVLISPIPCTAAECTPGSSTAITLVGGTGSFMYTTGLSGSTEIRITVNCDGPGGSSAPSSIVVHLW